MRISDGSSDVCSSDLAMKQRQAGRGLADLLQDSPLPHPLRARPFARLSACNLRLRATVLIANALFDELNVIDLVGCLRVRVTPVRVVQRATSKQNRALLLPVRQIGRASRRERVCQTVSPSVGAVSCTQKRTPT